MPKKLQLANASIESGNKRLGRQLLAQVILEEPNNESAWIAMSELVVSEKKKRVCLEQVLKINPNNQQAIQGLEMLRLSGIKSETSLAMANIQSKPNPFVAVQPFLPPSQEIVSQPQSEDLISIPEKNAVKPLAPKIWLNHTPWAIHALVLFEDKILMGKIEPQFGNRAVKIVLKGNMPTDLMTEKVSISFSELIKIKGSGTSLNLYFENQNGLSETAIMECKDKESLNAILDALESKLGTEFERASVPFNRKQTIAGGVILMLVVAAISAFLYFSSLAAPESGSTMSLIGPTSIVCIAGGLLTILFGIMVYILTWPPMTTTIARKEVFNNPTLQAHPE